MLGLHGGNKVHVALEDLGMSVLDRDPTSSHSSDQGSLKTLHARLHSAGWSHTAMKNTSTRITESESATFAPSPYPYTSAQLYTLNLDYVMQPFTSVEGKSNSSSLTVSFNCGRFLSENLQ